MSTITLHQVSKKFSQSDQPIFHNSSYSFQSNRSYALMGPSGIGKSTLLAMIAGLDHVNHGSISFNETVISNQTFTERISLLQNQIAMIFQQPNLISELTVLENVMLKNIISENVTKFEINRALTLLSDIGLTEKASCFVHTLSGGQQQRVAILRSIFQAPQFLLADEPTGNLDQHSAQKIVQLLLSYQKKYSMGLIITTHDMSVAKQCDHIVTIQDQKLVTVL